MTGILLVAHGSLAEQLVNSVAMIMGRLPLLKAVGLRNDQSLEDFATEVKRVWAALEEEGALDVLIMVDMFGGSCSNVTAKLMKERDAAHVAVVTGVNLPMVLEAAIDRDLYTLPDLLPKILDSGRKSIVDVRAALNQKLRSQ